MNDRPAYDFAMGMYEVCEAFKSIVDAIVNSTGIDNMDALQLRVVLDAIKVACDHAEINLNEIDNAAWREANDDDSNAN